MKTPSVSARTYNLSDADRKKGHQEYGLFDEQVQIANPVRAKICTDGNFATMPSEQKMLMIQQTNLHNTCMLMVIDAAKKNNFIQAANYMKVGNRALTAMHTLLNYSEVSEEAYKKRLTERQAHYQKSMDEFRAGLAAAKSHGIR